MDWASVAPLLVDHDSKPLLVVDSAGYVRTVNAALERLLGWCREDIVGHRALHAWMSEPVSAQVESFVRSAQVGTVGHLACTIPTRKGSLLRASLELVAVGSENDRTLLVWVSSAEGSVSLSATESTNGLQLDSSSSVGSTRLPSCALDELEYEISTRDFGIVLWVSARRSEELKLGARCYESRFGVSSPCSTCPALKLRRKGEQAHGIVGGSKLRFIVEFVTARQCEPGRARIRALPLDDESLRAATRARVERLAEASGLSARERTVLHMLIQGQSPAQIAAELGIVPRTVKFHQANLLDKLGAESRVDLLRILL